MLDELLLLLGNLGLIGGFLGDTESPCGHSALWLQLDNHRDAIIGLTLFGDADNLGIDCFAVPATSIYGLPIQRRGHECRDNNRDNNRYDTG